MRKKKNLRFFVYGFFVLLIIFLFLTLLFLPDGTYKLVTVTKDALRNTLTSSLAMIGVGKVVLGSSGFETGDLSEWTSFSQSGGGLVGVNTLAWAGTYSTEIDKPATIDKALAYKDFTAQTNGDEYFVRVYLYLDSDTPITAERIITMRDGVFNTREWELHLRTDRKLDVYVLNGNQFTSTNAIPFDTWTRVEVRVKLDDIAGELELRFNGNTEGSVTGIDTYNRNNNRLQVGSDKNYNGAFHFYVDDVMIKDTDWAGPSGAPDTTPPVITNIAESSVTSSSATITWTTDESSDSSVNYSKTISLGTIVSDAGLLASHSVQITGLSSTTQYFYEVTSCDSSSNCATSSMFNFITTTPDTTPPDVSITSPANGSTVSGTITITATASDNVGITGVQFKVDGNNIGTEDTISPYSVSLDTTTLTNSLHTLTAVARDADGNQATSLGVSITVSNIVSGVVLTLQPSQTKQTWMAWWGTMSSPIFGATASARMPLSVFNQMLDDLANDFGLTGARLPIHQKWVMNNQGYEATNDNSDPFNINTAVFYQEFRQTYTSSSGTRLFDVTSLINEAVLPLKSRVEANGDRFSTYLSVVGKEPELQPFWLPNPPACDNGNEEEFAELVEAYLQWMQNDFGYIPEFVSVNNEPGTGFFDNCNSPKSSQLAEMAEAVGKRLQSRGWNTKIIWDENVIPGDIWKTNTCLNDPTCSQYIGLVSYHSYDYNSALMPGSFGTRNTRRDRAATLGIGTAMTEICCKSGWNGQYDHGLQMARDIYWTMTEADGSAWMGLGVTQPCSSAGCPTGSSDYISVEPGPNYDDYYKLPAYYGIRQFSHYVRPDDVRVEMTCTGCTSDSTIGLHTKSVAFKKLNGNHVSVVINDKTSQQTVNLAGFPAGTYDIEGIDPTVCTGGTGVRDRCTPTQYAQQTISAGQNLVLSMPARAIVTFEQVVAAGPDTTPPIITNVNAVSVSSSSATITWTTDEVSDSSVNYGTTISLGTVVSDASLLASHSTQLTGLSSITQYFYAATSCDASGNCATSSINNFTTLFLPPPQCSFTNAYWSTDSTIEGQIVNLTVEGTNCDGELIDFEVWEDDAFVNPDDAANITPSSMLVISGKAISSWTAEWQCDGDIGGLCFAGNPEYYFNAILSSDNSINIQSNFTLKVLSATDTTPPAISNIATSNLNSTSATITWTTDEVSDSSVNYGTTISLGTVVSDASLLASHSTQLVGLSTTQYFYAATSCDVSGNCATSSTNNFTTAAPDTTSPTVSITSPTNGATVSGTITITATASDNIGVLGVQFKVDGNNIGTEDTIFPYSVSLLDTTTLTNSLHTLTAVARDANGNQATSLGVNVTVSNVMAQGTIAVNPSITYQTINGWAATAYAGQLSQAFPNYKDALFNLAINDLGINRVRLEVRSGAENDQDYWTMYQNGQIAYTTWRENRYATVNDNSDPFVINWNGFYFSELDNTVDNIVLPLKQRVEANGEKLFINLNYVAFTSQIGTGLSYDHLDPQEYAEFILAVFSHLQSKYGLVPDSLEIILEPDNIGGWDGTTIGNAIPATASLLAANGFTPRIVAPSTSGMSNAVPYFDAMILVPGALQYMSEISYHRYWGVSDANLQTIASRAIQYGLDTSMLEHMGSGYQDLHKDLKIARNSAWQQFALADTTGDSGGIYYYIDDTNPGNPIINIGSKTKFLRQYFKYVRSGAVRIEATTANSNFDPVAFVNTDGKYVVVVNAATGGSFSIQGLPAGTYGIKYTTSSQYDIDLTDTIISSGQIITTNIPATGVLTVYAKTQPVPDTTPPVITNVNAGPVSSSSATITWTTDEFSNSSVSYGTTIQLGTVVSDASLLTSHSTQITTLSASTQYFYAATSCDASGNCATSSMFNFITTAPDTTPPIRSNGQPSGTLSSGTTQTILSLTTDESSTCNYDTNPGVDYDSMSSQFGTTGSLSHSQLIQGLQDNQNYTYYVRCNDIWGNKNTDDFIISFSVSSGPAPQCVLTNAYWSTDSTIEGQVVNLTVEGTNCDGEFANFEIFEQDTVNPDDAVNITPSNGLFISGKAISSWTAEWQNDCGGLCNPPEYYFNAILSSDNSVNIQSNPPLLDVLSATDTTPPAITNVNAGSISSSSATITWTTDEAADSQVEYGSDTSYGTSVSNMTLKVDHLITLTGLNPDTLYHFRVVSTDPSDNTATSGDNTFTTSALPPLPTNITLDKYGGCSNCNITGAATGFFHIEKIGNRWWFIDPLGNPFWMKSIYNIDSNSINNLAAKYGDKPTWASQVINRMKAWGFNTIGEYSENRLQPYGTYGGASKSDDRALNSITFKAVSLQALSNTRAWITEPVHDIIAGIPAYTYNGWQAPLVDVYDPEYALVARAFVQDLDATITGGLASQQWIVGITLDDADKIFGFKGEGSLSGTKLPYPHPSFLILATDPNRAGAQDPKVYSKDALRDFLKTRYNNDINAINTAWGSSYTTWDSAGGYATGTGFLDEDCDPAKDYCGTDMDKDDNTDADPDLRNDMDDFLFEFATQYFKTIHDELRAVDTNHMLFGPASIAAHSSRLRPQILAAGTPYLDAWQFTYDRDFRRDPNYGDSDLGMIYNYDNSGKPVFLWIGESANADSAMSAWSDPWPMGDATTQAERASMVVEMVTRGINMQGADGNYFVLGYDFWSWGDNIAEQTNWGLVTRDDNAYDGFEARIAPCTDPWGFPCGGEAADYGDFLTPVIQFNKNIYSNILNISGVLPQDTTPPVITNVNAGPVSSSSATITWATDEFSNSSVSYGTTASLGTIVSDASFLTSHSIQLTTLSASTQYFYEVTSCDSSSNCATSSMFNFMTTAPDTTSPTVSITSPTSGSTVSCILTISVFASDNIGVAGVQFKVDGSNVGTEDTIFPYSVSLDTTALTDGSHTLTAVARDTSNNLATSSGVTINVNNIGQQCGLSGLVGEWKLNENSGQTIADSSGNNNGFLGSTSAVELADPTWTAGIIESGLDFDAVDDYAEIPDDPSLRGMSELSITAWVKRRLVSGVASWRYVVKTHPNSNQYTFFFDTQDSLRFVPRNSTGGNICDVSSGTTKVSADSNWYFVVGTYDGVNCKAYIDGSLIATVPGTGEPVRNTVQSIRIGYDSGGIIDEVQIYNRGLSDSEVLLLYNAVTNGSVNDTTPPTVSIISPSDGAIVSGVISIDATAFDNIGIAGVQFKVDGSNIGVEDTISSYSVLLNTTTLTNSLHTLTAVARDTSNNLATSLPITINVNNTIPDTTPPTATAICSPSTVTTGDPFPCTCSGSDNIAVGSISESSTSGSTSDTSVTGTFIYTCTVTDTSGNSASATDTYTVSPVPPQCVLTNAYWNTNLTIEGQTVDLTVEGSNCDGEFVNFKVFERDTLTQDDTANITPPDGFFTSGKAMSLWTAEWQCDGDIGGWCAARNPEYYFNAILSSDNSVNIQSDPPLLRVLESPATCGNNLTQAGEQCDDGNLDQTDRCNNACQLTVCGDGIVQNPNGQSVREMCDDGNSIDTDGCKNDCTLPPPPSSTLNITIIKPEQGITYKNRIVPLRFFATGDSCRYELNGINTFSLCKVDTILNITPSERFVSEEHNLSVFTSDSTGEINESISFSVLSTRRIKVRNEKFHGRGISTDLTVQNDSELETLSSLTFDNEHGTIEYLEIVNLSKGVTETTNISDIDSNVNISLNKVLVDSVNYLSLNKSVKITLKNLQFTNPQILADGVPCEGISCWKESYTSGTLIFNASHFTTYSAWETPTPACSDGIQNQDETGVDCGGSVCGACPGVGDGGGGGGGITTTTLSLPENSYLWTKIIPGIVTIIKDFDAEIGIKQIQIEVKGEVQDVEVTVTKYDDKPAAVSRAKEGKIYQYLQIEAINLEDKLSKAIIQFRVEKSWIAENNLQKENVEVHKFDESSENWNELVISYIGEDDDYDYYDTELNSLSYFVILVPDGEEKRSLVWWWVLAALGVLILIVALIAIGRRFKAEKQQTIMI